MKEKNILIAALATCCLFVGACGQPEALPPESAAREIRFTLEAPVSLIRPAGAAESRVTFTPRSTAVSPEPDKSDLQEYFDALMLSLTKTAP